MIKDKYIQKLEELVRNIDDLYIIRSAMATYNDVNEYKPEYRKLINQEETMYFKTEKLRKELSSLKKQMEKEKNIIKALSGEPIEDIKTVTSTEYEPEPLSLRDEIIHYQIWADNFRHEYGEDKSGMQLVNAYFDKSKT